ncbi:MAG: hypothetical protein JSS96_05705, partial [Bacteroidetes bacterium]|nr:hypothetical protein [Bacteroidota bacterium]
MKKHLLILAVLLAGISITARAQFNKTYSLSGTGLITGNIALPANTTGGNDIVMCSPAISSGSTTINKCVLIKTDNNGNVLAAKERDTSNSIERIIETSDNGILLVSLFLYNVVITKYDNNLNQVWAYTFPQNYDGSMAFGYSNNVDIEKVSYPNNPPNDQENYYIIYTAGPPNPVYNNDANVGIIRLHQNGTLVWSKTYVDANRAYYGNSTAIRDFGHSITSFTSPSNPNQKILAIAGTRDLYDTINIRTTTLFSFEIDENGNMLTPYENITTGGTRPFDPDILWDGSNLAMTYIEVNSGINPAPGNASGVGLLRCSASYTSFIGRYYWSKCENYGLSLTMSSDGNYIVGGWQSFCSPSYDASPMLFKVNKSTLSQMFCQQYNIKDNYGNSGFHRTDNANLNYILGSGSSDLRLIKTNTLGVTCGNASNAMQRISFTPSVQDLTYNVVDNPQLMPITIMDFPVSIITRTCTGNASSYKLAGTVTPLANAAISVYPTLIDRENEMIT